MGEPRRPARASALGPRAEAMAISFFRGPPPERRRTMRLLSTSRTRRRVSTKRRAPARHLSLEGLEDRNLLSNFTVLNLNDSGPGSLRAAVAAANATTGVNVIDFTAGL